MKTTKSDFEYFKSRCQHWVGKLNLKNWSVYYKHENMDDTYARTAWQITGMAATITLNKTWDDFRDLNVRELDKLALHEVMHILMSPLTNVAEARFVNAEEIVAAEHAIVRTLENCLV